MYSYVSLRRRNEQLFYFKQCDNAYFLVNLEACEAISSPISTKQAIIIVEAHTGHKRTISSQQVDDVVNRLHNVDRRMCINLYTLDTMVFSRQQYISRIWLDVCTVKHFGKCGYMALAYGRNYITHNRDIHGSNTADTVIDTILSRAQEATDIEHMTHLEYLRRDASPNSRMLPERSYCRQEDCKFFHFFHF